MPFVNDLKMLVDDGIVVEIKTREIHCQLFQEI